MADEIEFLLSQDLRADVMFDCFKTSKGNAIVEGSKSSAAKAFKNILAALIDKHAKLKVASREADKYRGELEVASLAVEKYPLDNVRLLGENAGFQAWEGSREYVGQGRLSKPCFGHFVACELIPPSIEEGNVD